MLQAADSRDAAVLQLCCWPGKCVVDVCVCVWWLELGGLSLTLNFLENCLFRVVCSPLLTSEGSLRMTGENCKLVVFVGALRLRDEKDSIQNRRTGWSIMCVVYYVDWGTLGEGIWTVAAAAMFIPKCYFPQVACTRTWIVKMRMRDLDWDQDMNLNKGYLRWYFILLFNCKVLFFSTWPMTYTKVLMRSQAWPDSVSEFVSGSIDIYVVEYLHLASL